MYCLQKSHRIIKPLDYTLDSIVDHNLPWIPTNKVKDTKGFITGVSRRRTYFRRANTHTHTKRTN